ncbi:hypothetical protein J6590_054863 [Homalodisca vitripennis]|nr:hypothetical protein J6590_054863 [Homalodisca vitripennis]
MGLSTATSQTHYSKKPSPYSPPQRWHKRLSFVSAALAWGCRPPHRKLTIPRNPHPTHPHSGGTNVSRLCLQPWHGAVDRHIAKSLFQETLTLLTPTEVAQTSLVCVCSPGMGLSTATSQTHYSKKPSPYSPPQRWHKRLSFAFFI